MHYRYLDSPLGRLLLVGSDAGLNLVHMDEQTQMPPQPGWTQAQRQLDEACRQLDEYFGGQRRCFDLPLAPQGTAFQQAVWQALLEIPFGETRSYRQQAERIGRPSAIRAVGTANGANPLAVIVPCHRVIGSDGSLTGYAGGLARKALLLELEGVRLPAQVSLML
ncbi:methylated-DNA--[protein]-cysteine S-methyltransferase [Pseudomonas sp.]|jgi:methylated-DNA-[protein]-cysteine S-methyltransferase|uniref:methylated-DNA--[protein]-cysteine S-methyltransferase n=1 Tax=Pseudomonas sp. TaxID=306 RepID=UPI0028ACDEDA|nr:methylated-DNA--[protein]-cysteine S-methyltransferase [Pseudomonas sp.]